MSLFGYAVAGGGFILIGAWESLSLSTDISAKSTSTLRFSSAVTCVSVSVLSFLFIANSFISISHALTSKDPIGVVIQLQVISISLLFLLSSVLGFVSSALQLPSEIPNLLSLFAFGEEFLLFYLQRKDPSGVENRYYDLFLVPITICAFCTILELKTPKSNYARLGRGIGLILQGMWILQMGFSFFSGVIAHGCSLHAKSRGNYTIKCDGHPAYHRGRAIATLQFNCHLALLVAVISVVYSVVSKKIGINRDAVKYRPLGAEVEMGSSSNFTLDSDDDDEENVVVHKGLPVGGASGYHNHQ